MFQHLRNLFLKLRLRQANFVVYNYNYNNYYTCEFRQLNFCISRTSKRRHPKQPVHVHIKHTNYITDVSLVYNGQSFIKASVSYNNIEHAIASRI